MLVLLIGGAMCAISAGVLELLHDPVIEEYEPAPIATDATVPQEPETAEPAETQMPLSCKIFKEFCVGRPGTERERMWGA